MERTSRLETLQHDTNVMLVNLYHSSPPVPWNPKYLASKISKRLKSLIRRNTSYDLSCILWQAAPKSPSLSS